MGGRGSGGSRSGGGASANPPRLVSPSQYYQEKYRDLTDKELNRALINSRNQMNKEKIDFSDDDSEEQRRLKQAVIETKAELAERIKAEIQKRKK